MRSEPLAYHAYIVRVWKETPVHGDNQGWRFTLSTSMPEGRQGFTTPEALCDSLYQAVLTLMQNEQKHEIA